MYVSLDKNFLDKNLSEAQELAKEEYGEDTTFCIFPHLEAKFEECEIKQEEGVIEASFTGDLGYIQVEIPLSTDLMEALLNHTLAKLNKFKTIIQALK